MAQPVAKYNGDFITCYPGSNQLDDGKLNLEKNMARIVTRLSSKNFCIVKPSFEIEKITNVQTGAPQLRVLPGQASINGMDIIAEDSLVIDPPEKAGTYHLALKLARDSSWNVLGDFVYGDTTTFEGVYLSYFTDKPDPIDPDMLYLGQVTWNGSDITKIVEDQDKYGRIWAEDILCKINDPKHPDITRLTLQDWIYKVPDWYVSKEGDVEFGAIDFLPGRNGTQSYGVKVQATNNNTALLKMKAPSITSGDTREFIIESNNKGVKINFLDTEINCYKDMLSDLYWNTESAIYIHSKQDIDIKGDSAVALSSLSSTANKYNHLVVADSGLVYSSDITSALKYIVNIKDTTTIQQTLGKAIWQYNDSNNKVSLLDTNVDYLEIIPNSDFHNKLRVRDTILLGNSSTYGNERTYLTNQLWRISDNNSNVANSKYITIAPDQINIVNPLLSSTVNSIINLRNTADTIHTKIFDNGKIELLNNTSDTPGIRFSDGTANNNASIYKVQNAKKIQVDGALGVNSNIFADGTVTGNGGLVTQSGTVTFIRGNSNATITKDNNSSILRTNGYFYVGSGGNLNLYAGPTVIKGSATIGSSAQCTISDNGNINTSGTITGSKVYNAVYNGFGEIFRKDSNEEIEYGDLVCLREDGLVHKVESEEDIVSIIGICSDTIGVEMGGIDIPEPERVEVEMLGQIWVKTDNLDIRPGHLVRALPNAKVDLIESLDQKIGIAITPTNPETGKVRIVYCFR